MHYYSDHLICCSDCTLVCCVYCTL